MLGIWGIGNTMIIFLAAVLDVPRHLYESAELDGAGAWRRLRWVTLPTISPVLLFAVVLGMIQGAAVLHAGVRRGERRGRPGVAGRHRQHARARLPARARRSSTPCSSTTTASASSTWATRRRWPCCCWSSAFAATMIIIRNTRRWVHYGTTR